MKRLLPVLTSLVLWSTMALPVHATEVMKSFHLDATLEASRKVEVTETIKYDFGTADRHGIIRTIPEVYDRNGAKYQLHFIVENVDMDGNPIPFENSHGSGDLAIKIGDADKTITGVHTYHITYSTTRSINDQQTGQEWYWNVTGNENTVTIESASAKITGPVAPTRQVCYTGNYGSDAQDCVVKAASNVVTVTANHPLQESEGLTVAIEFPTSTFAAIPFSQALSDFLTDNIPLLLPILVFLIMLLIWAKFGRDPRGRGTVIAQYEPPLKLKPALMAALDEQHLPKKAITATVLDLARRGFLQIIFEDEKGWFSTKTTFKLKKLNDADNTCESFESSIMDGLFDKKDLVSLSEVKDFYQVIQDVDGDIFDTLRSKKWFGTNPAIIRGSWIAVGSVVGFVGLFLTGLFGGLFVISAAVSGLIIVIFGWFMPRMTKDGAVIREEIEGFKLFLSVTEAERLKFFNAPAKRPEQFEAFLPYAIAFGVEKQWAEQFKDLKLEQPSYVSGNAGAWNTATWLSLTDSFHQSSSSSIYRAPSSAGSGGSGFSGGGSGGGFGGGGSSSW